MKTILLHNHPHRRLKSFYYAFKGLQHAFKHEANFRIQVCIIVLSIVLGFARDISMYQWLFLIVAGTVLLAGELMNTVVEEFIDHLIHEHHEGARVIKDLSAGFVLVCALGYLAVFTIIFLI